MKTVGTLIEILRRLPQDSEVFIGTGGVLDKAYEIEEIDCSLVAGGIDGDCSCGVYIVADRTERGA